MNFFYVEVHCLGVSVFPLGHHVSFKMFLVPLYCVCACDGCVVTVDASGCLHIICVCGRSVATVDVTGY